MDRSDGRSRPRPVMVDKLAGLKNLGPESSKWLRKVGLHSKADLEKIGSLKAYALVREAGFPASLNLVYALQAMLMDLHWQKLPTAVRNELKVAVRLMASGDDPPPWNNGNILRTGSISSR